MAAVKVLSTSVAEKDSRDIETAMFAQRDCIKTSNVEWVCVVLHPRRAGVFESIEVVCGRSVGENLKRIMLTESENKRPLTCLLVVL